MSISEGMRRLVVHDGVKLFFRSLQDNAMKIQGRFLIRDGKNIGGCIRPTPCLLIFVLPSANRTLAVWCPGIHMGQNPLAQVLWGIVEKVHREFHV